jgi:predicted HTH transcriptional regulator
MSEKGSFFRNGTAADPMPQKMIDELFSKRTKNSLGKIKSSRQNLSFEQLKIYYQEKGKPLNEQFATNLELLDESGNYNYVAYLMADSNGTSIKVAKYKGINRVNLEENPDFGYESLIKSAKSVLDKIEIENKFITEITSHERSDKRYWSPIALREAILNAFVHNDYATEVPPKFEFFEDRIEITSTGGLPLGLSEKEFFEGYSVPRNKEIMRIFKDVGLVEQLGSGVPRILESYGKECFTFSEHFLRMTFYADGKSNQVGNQVGNQVSNQGDHNSTIGSVYRLGESILAYFDSIAYKPTQRSYEKYTKEAKSLTEDESQIINFCASPKKRKEILEDCLGISNQTKNFKTNIEPLIERELIQQTIKDKPQSQYQKYIQTTKGKVVSFIYDELNKED